MSRALIWGGILALAVVGILLGRSMMAPAKPGVQEITVEGTEYRFDPDEIRVDAGQTVRIIFRNVGILEHDLAVPDLNLATATVAAGREAVLEFRPDRPGSFDIICTVPGHKELGMTGTIVVQ